MHSHDYPDLTLENRKWSVFGSRCGEATTEYFNPTEVPCEGAQARRSWVWVDELIQIESGEEAQEKILIDAHSPHEYSGYELHVRKQPVITTFGTHDHLIIPDLDVETPGDQTVSIILSTHFIWTRRSGKIARLDELLDSNDLRERGPQHDTAVYAFVGILRVMLESLDRQLMRRERQSYALEDRILQRELKERPEHERPSDDGVPGDDDSLTVFLGLSDSRTLVELRIQVAWLRKQYGAFDRMVNSLYDPAHGAFRKANGPALEGEASPYFQHLSDQIQRGLTKVEHLRDTHATLNQLLSAEQAERTNRTLLRLTWLTIIVLPVGVIVDIFGMNVSAVLPPHSLEIDNFIAVACISAALLAAALYYRRENRRDSPER